jgi:hypothetical protein
MMSAIDGPSSSSPRYECPASLARHIARRIRSSLDAWSGSEEDKERVGRELADRVIQHCAQLQCTSDQEFRGAVMAVGEGISKVYANEIADSLPVVGDVDVSLQCIHFIRLFPLRTTRRTLLCLIDLGNVQQVHAVCVVGQTPVRMHYPAPRQSVHR